MDDTMLMFLENHNTNAPTTSRRILDSILLSRNLVVIHSYAFRTLTPESQSAMQIPQKGATVRNRIDYCGALRHHSTTQQ